MWEQLELAAFLQENWADNQVSCTVQFNPETEGASLNHALNYFQYRLKGISLTDNFLAKNSTYVQLPYEEITEEKYNELVQSHWMNVNHQEVQPNAENFCDDDKCSIQFETQTNYLANKA